MKLRLVLLSVCVGLAASACYRTTYTNLVPPEKLEEARKAPVPHADTSDWQHFFLFGWVPGERVIDTTNRCGGPDRVEQIHTERSFLQGLVTALCSFYINIYSPWTGEVRCAGDPPES